MTQSWKMRCAAGEGAHGVDSVRGRTVIASCDGQSRVLAERVLRRYREEAGDGETGNEPGLMKDIVRRFSDSETCVRIPEHVGGKDVYLFQTLCDGGGETTINDRYLSFLIAARAFREHGAAHVTGVVPYLAYARQDKPTRFMREPTTARLMADLAWKAGLDGLIAWHPHSEQIRGFYGGAAVHLLDPLDFFVDTFRSFRNDGGAVVVAPDAGASRVAAALARALGTANAAAVKFRPRPEKISSCELVGDFSNKNTALLVDDIISSGDTLAAVAKRVADTTGIRHLVIAASHNLCNPAAVRVLDELHEHYGLQRMVVTNSIPQTAEFTSRDYVEVKCLSEALACAIFRIHRQKSLSEVFGREEAAG